MVEGGFMVYLQRNHNKALVATVTKAINKHTKIVRTQLEGTLLTVYTVDKSISYKLHSAIRLAVCNIKGVTDCNELI